jgi:tRNA (guanine-N7-)-methyltransferase
LAPYLLRLPHAAPNRPPSADDPPPLPFDWEQVFGNSNPVELEVGSGKGLFLVTAAAANPGRNFVGVEIVPKYALYMTDRVARRQLANARTAACDGKKVLQHYVRPGSLAAAHVYFPDPWWKTRHKKRLLFTPDFAAGLATALQVGGALHFASDVRDYFDMVTAMLAAQPLFRPLSPPADNTPQHDMDYLTNFERKWRKEGRLIHRSRHERVDAPGS